MHGFLTEQLFFVYAVPDQSPDRVYHRLLILLIGHTEPFIRCIQYADFAFPSCTRSSIIFGSRYSALISSGFKPSKTSGTHVPAPLRNAPEDPTYSWKPADLPVQIQDFPPHLLLPVRPRFCGYHKFPLRFKDPFSTWHTPLVTLPLSLKVFSSTNPPMQIS